MDKLNKQFILIILLGYLTIFILIKFLYKSLKSKHIDLGFMHSILDWSKNKNPITYCIIIVVLLLSLILLLILTFSVTYAVIKNLSF